MRPGRAGRTGIALQSLRSRRAGVTLWPLGALSTSITSRAGRTWQTLRALGTGDRRSGARRACGTGIAFVALGTLGSLCAGIALGSLWAGYALDTLCPGQSGRARRSSRSGRPRRADRTLGPSISLGRGRTPERIAISRGQLGQHRPGVAPRWE